MKRSEFELELSKKQFDTLAAKKETAFLSKKRYFIPLENNLCCELDIYEDELAGLVTAEVEFPSQHEAKNFSPPDWFCKEVTFCAEYKNSNLARLGKP